MSKKMQEIREGKDQVGEKKPVECCTSKDGDELHYTLDGSVDIKGRPAIKGRTGGWSAGSLLLVNQGLATLAFFGVGVNLVLFLTRVLQQNNSQAANSVSIWTGTVYIFSLVGALLSDSSWGRYKTCAIFQLIFLLGLAMLSLCTYLFLRGGGGCGKKDSICEPRSSLENGLFYVALYLVALGYGGYQPNIATFGADQFDAEDPKQEEARSKVAFFSYFYLALNLGSLFSNTFLDYLEDSGGWALGFWASSASIFAALLLFLAGTRTYRHFTPVGNPVSKVCQVVVSACRKRKFKVPLRGDDLYELDGKDLILAAGPGRLPHTQGFRFLDRAAIVDADNDFIILENDSICSHNPWRLCTVSQVEEVKCVARLIPIWLTTIPYSVIFTQMASLFVEQGAAMNTTISGFDIPPASMSAFDILSVAIFVVFYRRLLTPLVSKLLQKDSISNTSNAAAGLTELQRMGIGFVIAIMAIVSAGIVEIYRLKNACGSCEEGSSMRILWQIPQFMLVGASEVFMYVGQLEFFNGQAPDGLKSFGSALCMTSISLGNFVSSLLVTVVMKITENGGSHGWIPVNLNEGHMDRFYFLLAILTSADFAIYLLCARWYRSTTKRDHEDIDETSSV